MYKHNKKIVLLWLIATLFFGYHSFKLPGILSGIGFEMEGSYATTEKIMKEDFQQSAYTIILLFENKGASSATVDFHQYIAETLSRIEKQKDVSGISSPLENPMQQKGNIAYSTVTYTKKPDDLEENIKSIQAQLHNQGAFTVSLTGGPVIMDEMNQTSQADLTRAEMIGLPIALIVLLMAFGGLVAATIPLIAAIIAVAVTMGAIYLLGQEWNLSIFILNVVPMVGFALGIDFALLFINRFREELKRHHVKEAIGITTQTAGRAIAFSGLCVILGLSGMFFMDIDIFQTVAIGGIAVVFVSVLSALTFLPALLSMIGDRINTWMLFKVTDESEAKWREFASFVMRRPIIMTILALALLLVAILPIRDIQLEIPAAGSLPAHSQTRIAYETFERNFLPSDQTQVIFIVETEKPVTNKQSLEEIEHFLKELREDEKVVHIESIFTLTGEFNADHLYDLLLHPQWKERAAPLMDRLVKNNKTLIYTTIQGSANSKEAKDWVREWEQKEMTIAFTIGGQAKFNQEIFDEIYRQSSKGLVMVLISTYFILLMAFRSLLIPLKAIFMNMFSLGAAFGIVVWVFQEGHFGIEPSQIALMVPIFAFAMVFGLSMDYEVFLISRIQEEYEKTKINTQATLQGLTTTSKIITSAALIMIVVTGAFAFTDIIPTKQVGIAVAIAILIDATLIRMILVPSLMKLLGDWNWWLPFRNKR